MDKKKRKRYSLRGKIIGFNLITTLAAMLICGTIFVVSVWIMVGNYIVNDINFFLKATAESLETKMEYCEDVIYRVRDSDIIMNYLEQVKKEGIKDTTGMREEIRHEFADVVSISNQSNLGSGSIPLIEQAYLFDYNGAPVETSYYAIIYAEKEKSDQVFRHVYGRFKKDIKKNPDKTYGFYPMKEGVTYLVFPIYNENMDSVGNIIYKIRDDALDIIMRDMENYSNSFWTLYDREQNRIYGKNDEQLENDTTLLNTFRYEPYKEKVKDKGYLIYRQELCMDLQVVIAIPENQASILIYNSMKIYIVLIVIMTTLACAVFVFVIYRMTQPITEITNKLMAAREGDFETKLPDYRSQEFHEISEVFNEMTSYVNHLIKQVYEKQISIKEMEMKFLQTQMNPHFMFNVLNTIALQAKMDENEDVYKMIRSFAQLIQAKIYRSDSEKVKIKQELEYVDYYLYLQSYRYGDRLNYQIEIADEELIQLYIPKLCIQLIVENAVVHGIEPMMENGTVHVKIYSKDNMVFIDTIDNGVGFETTGEIELPINKKEADSNHNHVGLSNAHHIIRLMYGEEYGITIHSKPGEGTIVSICIPFDRG